MKVAIAIDDWKLETFSRILTEEGFAFSKHNGLAHKTLLLTVETEDIIKLHEVVRKCQIKAAELKN